MDIFVTYKNLVKESLLFRSYKSMKAFPRILCFTALLPFIAVYTSMLLGYLVLATIYRVASSYFDYLHSFVREEGDRDSIKHATQAAIYWIAFPVILLLKIVLCLLTVMIYIHHFVTSFVGYIATFGGIKFSPFLFDKVDRFGKDRAIKHNTAAVVTFSVIAIILLTLSITFKPIADISYNAYKENAIVDTIVEEVKKAYDDKKISRDAYNEFIHAYNDGDINADNYLEYEAKYLSLIPHATWDIQAEATTVLVLNIIWLTFVASYISFVIIFVPIYNNVGKRKKYIEFFSKLSEEVTE